MRVCIMDILSRNVGIKQVEPVIRAVLRLVGMECDHLPKHTIISEMLLESRALSQVQLAETLANTEYNTLHSDGTTKFGQKYCGYQVSTAETSLTLGLQVHVCRLMFCYCNYKLCVANLSHYNYLYTPRKWHLELPRQHWKPYRRC